MPAKRKSRGLRCPTCKALVLRTEEELPFCSARCRLIDLGKWASGGYVISTPVTDPEELLDAEAKQRKLDRLHGEEDGSKPPN